MGWQRRGAARGRCARLTRPRAGPLVEPLLRFAGQDISHWFDERTQEVKTYIHPETNLRMPFLPYGRFVHVAPPEPVSDWATDFVTPWWQVRRARAASVRASSCAWERSRATRPAQDEEYCIGRLSAKTRRVRVVNVLTHSEDVLEVCEEESMHEILDRFLDFNAHAGSYTWKVRRPPHRPRAAALTPRARRPCSARSSCRWTWTRR